MNLLPTIYSLAIEANRTGVPLMRIGYLEFPDDAVVRTIDRAYCFGPDLWFVPITNAETTARIYLPGRGIWRDLRSGEPIGGGRWVRRRCEVGREPLFLRQGAVLLAELDDRTLSWGRSMTAGKRLCIVASAYGKDASQRRLHLTPERTLDVTADKRDGAWVFAAKDPWPDVSGFVVYGDPPRRVEWAGRALPAADPADAPDAGDAKEHWWYDGAQKAIKAIVPPDPKGKLRVCF
jgi:alpha-glucosidase (family GH31 glycosyl hydrolase)